MTLLDPQNLIQPEWTLSAPTSGAAANTLWLHASDGTGDGSVSFCTTAVLTGADWKAVQPAAMYRLVCLGLLWRLDEKSLRDAYDSLIDAYTTQNERVQAVEHPRPEARWVAAQGVDRVERTPFQFHDE